MDRDTLGGGRKRRRPSEEDQSEEQKSPARQRLPGQGYNEGRQFAANAPLAQPGRGFHRALAPQQFHQYAGFPQASSSFGLGNPSSAMGSGNLPMLNSGALARAFQQHNTGGYITNPLITGLPPTLPSYGQQQMLLRQSALNQAVREDENQRGMLPRGLELGQPLPGLHHSQQQPPPMLGGGIVSVATTAAASSSLRQPSSEQKSDDGSRGGALTMRGAMFPSRGLEIGQQMMPPALPSLPQSADAAASAVASVPTSLQLSSQQDSDVAPPAAGGNDEGESAAALTGRTPVILYMPCDDAVISAYQCLARKQIELFEAQEIDVDAGAQGRNRGIVLGQVGIRCIHCKQLYPRHRSKSSTFYPSKLNRIYQTAQNLGNTHLTKTCKHIPQEIRNELLRLQQDKKTSAGGGKEYWSDGARILGVYETDTYLRFRRHNDYPGYMPGTR